MHTVKQILVVADNQAERERLASCFADLPFGWKAHFADSLPAARALLPQRSYALVFADLSAGPYYTIQFLNEVHQHSPATARFLMSAHTDADLLVSCTLGVHQFLQKPITRSAVFAALDRSAVMDRLLQDSRIQSLLARVRVIPPRPALYVELLEELRSPAASAQSVGAIAGQDMAISAKLVQLINSASYGLDQPIACAEDAVLLLGMETTAALVLGIEAFARLEALKPVGFSVDHLWAHSQTVARHARQIADLVTKDRKIGQQAYTAGLLHDLGKLALAYNLGEDYRLIQTEARARNLPLHDIELEKTGATHAQAGAYLLGVWGMPGEIIEAVASHHLPARAVPNTFSAVAAVHLANALEYAKSSIQSGFPEFRLDLGYSENLNLQDYWEEIRDLVKFPRSSGATAIFTEAKRKTQNPAPQPQAKAAPQPEGFLARWFRRSGTD